MHRKVAYFVDTFSELTSLVGTSCVGALHGIGRRCRASSRHFPTCLRFSALSFGRCGVPVAGRFAEPVASGCSAGPAGQGGAIPRAGNRYRLGRRSYGVRQVQTDCAGSGSPSSNGLRARRNSKPVTGRGRLRLCRSGRDRVLAQDVAGSGLPRLLGGHHAITAGSLGVLARCRRTSARMLLSNNHVLADTNKGSAGDAILQPGPADGGTRLVARLRRFEPIHFDGRPNVVDAAVADLVEPPPTYDGLTLLADDGRPYGIVASSRPARLLPGDRVCKVGPTHRADGRRSVRCLRQ